MNYKIFFYPMPGAGWRFGSALVRAPEHAWRLALALKKNCLAHWRGATSKTGARQSPDDNQNIYLLRHFTAK